MPATAFRSLAALVLTALLWVPTLSPAPVSPVLAAHGAAILPAAA